MPAPPGTVPAPLRQVGDCRVHQETRQLVEVLQTVLGEHVQEARPQADEEAERGPSSARRSPPLRRTAQGMPTRRRRKNRLEIRF